tara:strand:- start:113 stop:613 length:501 start_codon:yes stop_codon:yes gene_type:complete
LIDRKKFAKKKRPRFSSKRTNGPLRPFNEKNSNMPRTRVGISKALEKYTGLAEDAFSNGDRIVAEGYFQYAEHYQRLLNDVPPDNNIHDKANVSELNKKSDINNLVSEKPSRTERAYNAKQDRKQKHEDSEIKKKSFPDQNNKISADEGAKNVTSDGIEALKPYEI